MQLGKIKKVDLRKAWNHEAFDFTKWISKTENISILSEEIGIEISVKETEAKTGRYSVDILAEEENKGHTIIIENQLETTDHDHLGKIITYASGYDAEIIIWIVKDVRDEHVQAIDWLNDHTDQKINLFLIKIELWQIEDSPYAPKFQIISKPNDWAKALKDTRKDAGLTDTKLMQLDFWTKFKQYCQQNDAKLKLRKVFPQHWFDISFGSSTAHISLTLNTQKDQIGCEIYIPDSKETYKVFHDNKEQIEGIIGESLEWMELPEKKASRIKLVRDSKLADESLWPQYFEWLKKQAEEFSKCFSSYKV